MTPLARKKKEIVPLHPQQPLALDANGVLRFRENAIVRFFMEAHREAHSVGNHGGMNAIACMDFTPEDRMQFAQLIGYSLSGYGDLSYVSNLSYESASLSKAGVLTPEQAQIQTLQETLDNVREGLLTFVPEMFRMAREDFEQE